MSYAINIAAAVLAALVAGLCAAGILEGSALLMVLCAAGLVIYLACKGFGRNPCQTGTVIVGVFVLMYLLWGVSIRWNSGELFSTLSSLVGQFLVAWAADGSWLLTLICFGIIIGLGLAQKKVELEAFSVLRYCAVTVLLVTGAKQALLDRLSLSLTGEEWTLLMYPIVLLAAMSLATTIQNRLRKMMWKTILGGFAYCCLLALLDAMQADMGVVVGRICTLMRLETPATLTMLALGLITLAGQNPKKPFPVAFRRPCAIAVWLMYMLLLRWRCDAMLLDIQGCWPVSAMGVVMVSAFYYQSGKKHTVKQQLRAAVLTLLGMLTMSMAILQTEVFGWRVYLLAAGLWLLGWLCAKLGSFWDAEVAARDCYLGAAAMTMLYVVKQGGTVELTGWMAAGLLAILWCGVVLGLNRAEKLSKKSGIWSEEYQWARRACAMLPLLPALLTAGYIIF